MVNLTCEVFHINYVMFLIDMYERSDLSVSAQRIKRGEVL